MKATMIVPNTPTNSRGSPAFWFGLQTNKGDGALVQPIMAKWLGDSFYMFQEIFDWTDFQDKQTDPIKVHAGDVITAQVECSNDACTSYAMTMNSTGTSEQSIYSYSLLQTATESTAYIVLEHQPDSCNELPNPGLCSWNEIEIDVNNKPVKNPLFVAAEESPKCKSKAVVGDGFVNITWAGVSRKAPLSSPSELHQCNSDADCSSICTYCQNGAGKTPPFVCHTPTGGCCLDDQDCDGSYCMNGPGHAQPWKCHGGQ